MEANWLKKRGYRSAETKVTKTDQIANVFSENPLDAISPKDISAELGLDIKLVTTIVNRLRKEGMIERVGWGKYRLSIDNSIEDEVLEMIADEMSKMTMVILGIPLNKINGDSNGSAFKNLVSVYRKISEIGGELMAQNVLRLSASKKLGSDKVEPLISAVMEVSV